MRITKGIFYLLVFCLVLCVLLCTFVKSIWPERPSFDTPPINRVASSCWNLAGLIGQFYEDRETDVLIDPKVEFLAYISRKGPYIVGDGLEWNEDGTGFSYGIYLLLPVALPSEAPTLLAFSTPCTLENGEVERVALFHRNHEIIPLKLPSYYVKWIVGKDIEVEMRPDLYFDPFGKLESEL